MEKGAGPGSGPVDERGWVWLNGTMVAAQDAVISPFDHGFLTGDGVFETLKAYEGEPFEFEAHFARLERGAERFGLAVPAEAVVREAIFEVLRRNGAKGGDCRIRITLTGGKGPLGSDRGGGQETLLVACGALPRHAGVARVMTLRATRNESGLLAGCKSISYGENVVALAEARSRGADEAIFPNTRGELCEGTGSNVFLVRDGRVVTPPLSSGCLAGVTRGVVMELLAGQGLGVEEIGLPLGAIGEAEEVFLTSSLREVQPVGWVNGVALEAPGPVTERVRSLFRARVAEWRGRLSGG